MLLFILFGIVAVAAAVGVVASRKPVQSALFLLLNFATLAGLYVQLQAQFLAAVQVIVYAGAIVVLFLFVVMLIGGGELRDLPGRGERLSMRRAWPRAVAIVLLLLLVAGLAYGVVARPAFVGTAGDAAVFGQGSAEAIGQALFTDYLLAFELTSILLLIGMIGAVVLARPPESS